MAATPFQIKFLPPMGRWQTWCMHRTENPAKVVRFRPYPLKRMHVTYPLGVDHRRMVINGGSNPAASTIQDISSYAWVCKRLKQLVLQTSIPHVGSNPTPCTQARKLTAKKMIHNPSVTGSNPVVGSKISI